MPRKIGYGNFTPARKAALKKAQLASARARRKNKFESRSRRKKTKKVLGAAAAAAVAAGVGYQWQKNYKELVKQSEINFVDTIDNYQELKEQAGDVFSAAQTQEEWDARVKLYGDAYMIGEYSVIHKGRPEIFPTLPGPIVAQTIQQETVMPSYNLETDLDPSEKFITLYHRTGGGKDVDPEEAKKQILETQSMKILNRDEKNFKTAVQGAPDLTANRIVYFSNKLNDSNTRAAFGETVVQLKVPREFLRRLGFSQQSFGELSPNKEVWGQIHESLLSEILKVSKIEDVPPSMIQPPPPERKFKAPR